MHARIKVISWLAALGLVALAPAQQETEHQLKLDLSALLDVTQVWTLNADALDAKYRAPGFSENPFIRWANGRSVATFSKQPFSNVAVELTMLEGTLVLEEAAVVFGSDGKAKRVELRCGTPQGLEAHFFPSPGNRAEARSARSLGLEKGCHGQESDLEQRPGASCATRAISPHWNLQAAKPSLRRPMLSLRAPPVASWLSSCGSMSFSARRSYGR